MSTTPTPRTPPPRPSAVVLTDTALLDAPDLLEAENENAWCPDEPTPSVDVFHGDLGAYLSWLSDCVAIERSIRSRGT